MSKYRIYDLAKEFRTDNKTILNILREHDIAVKSHSSTVGDAEKSLLQKTLQKAAFHKEDKQTALAKKPVKANDANGHQGQNHVEAKKQPENDRQEMALQHEARSGENIKNREQNNKNGERRERANTPANRQANNNRSAADNRGRNNKTNRQGKNRPSQGRDNRSNAASGTANTGSHQGNAKQRTNNHGNNNGRQQNNANGRQNNGNAASRFNNNSGQNNGGNKNSRNDSARGNRRNFGDNKNGGRPNNNHRPGMNGSNRRNWKQGKNNKAQQPAVKQEIIRPKLIKVGETITVKELASKMTYAATDVIKKLMMLGTFATINQQIDFDTAVLVADSFGIEVEELPPEVDLTEIPEYEDAPEDLLPRPPVVTVMGHVDHGKTSLLDVIRKTSVTSVEAGGITQHIGAYQVICNNKKITFLDTPGHEAFTAMRARGAQATDIAVLVVAADDGVMPQTIEAINHAKAAKVPIVVAINKMDKAGANPEHVKQQLAEHELVAEEWGGDTIMVPVSAKKKEGIGDLLETILLVAEVQELKANPNRDARGIIIEAQLDKGRGPVATILVQNGTLHIGDSIIAGTAYGKVRAMINDRGEKVKKAGPSIPVEVLGLADVPEAGDEMAVLDEHMVRTIAEKRIEKQRTQLINNKKVSLDDLFQQINEGSIKDLNILLKADVQGSVEALKTSLLGLNKSDEVRVNIIHAGVGAVNESDVMLASAANALVLAFNVRPDNKARKLADTEKIDIRTYRVIYEAIGDIEDAMRGMLAPKYKETILGKVEIRQVMKFSKVLVAGSYVLEGKITNSSKIRIIRDNVVVHEGEIDSLRRFKDDVKEVMAGYECGITIENYRDFKEGDIIEAYIMEEVAPQSL